MLTGRDPATKARLDVEVVRTWPAESEVDELRQTFTSWWPGYTAAEAMENRIERLKWARRAYEVEGNVLTLRRQLDGYVEVERITFTDAPDQ